MSIQGNPFYKLPWSTLTSLPDIWFSTKAHFWLKDYVNKQKCHIWAHKNPHKYDTKSLHLQYLTVWAALSSKGIIGPTFISQNIIEKSYWKMLEKEMFPQMKRLLH